MSGGIPSGSRRNRRRDKEREKPSAFSAFNFAGRYYCGADLSANLLLGLRVSIGTNACMLIETLSPGRGWLQARVHSLIQLW